MDGEQTIKLKQVRRRIEATDANLSGSGFSDVNLSKATFENVNLAGVTIHDANMSGVRITHANTEGMTIEGISVADLMKAYRASKSN